MTRPDSLDILGATIPAWVVASLFFLLLVALSCAAEAI